LVLSMNFLLELSAQCLAFDQGILRIYSSNYSMKAVAKIPQSAIHLEIQHILLSIFF